MIKRFLRHGRVATATEYAMLVAFIALAIAAIKRFLRHGRIATATEYAMLVVFIALAIAASARPAGGPAFGLNTWFSNVSASIANLNTKIPQ